MSLSPKSFKEALAQFRGEGLSEFRQRQKHHDQAVCEAKQLVGLPPAQWPSLSFNWDTSAPSQRYSLDATTAESFHEFYPKGFALGWVTLSGLDEKLSHFSRRDTLEELWGSGFKDKLSSMIAYLSHGGPISPPLVKPLKTSEVIFQGGNHRYAVAKAVGILELPIHVEPQHKAAISLILPIRWCTKETLDEITSN